MSIRVLVVGHRGRMGTVCREAIATDDALVLADVCGRGDDLAAKLHESGADVVIDLTLPSIVAEHTQLYIDHGLPFVIGTSGLTARDIDGFHSTCTERGAAGLVVSNFSLATVWLLRLTRLAADAFDHIEIVEGHHEHKVDAPSGTACHTTELIHEARQGRALANSPSVDGDGKVMPARGDRLHDIPVHAVRSPGMVAEQQVIFGGLDETLTLSQRTVSRRAFIPGMQLALKSVQGLDGLVVGLESLLP